MHASSIIFFILLTATATSNDYANSYTMIRNNNYIEVSSPPYTLNDSTMIQLGFAEMSDNEQQNTNKESKTNTDAYDIDEVMEDVGYPIIGTIGGSI